MTLECPCSLDQSDCEVFVGRPYLEKLKWYLWHSNVYRALQRIDDLDNLLALAVETPESRKFEKAVEDLGKYITVNKSFIPTTVTGTST